MHTPAIVPIVDGCGVPIPNTAEAQVRLLPIGELHFGLTHVASSVWRSLPFLVAVVCTIPEPTKGQMPPLQVGPTDSATLALIEAEGAAFPRAAVTPPYPEHFLKGWIADQDRLGPPPKEIGSAARKCVAVPPGGVVIRRDTGVWVPTAYMRSGDFRMSGGRAMTSGQGQKLPWTPAWPSPGMELMIRAQRLTEPRQAFHTVVKDVLWEDSADGALRPWESSFPTRIVFPAPGRWVVVGTSGNNWGCLVYTVA